MSDPFGTMTSEPSAVRMTLARMPMRLTSPTLPPTSMTSPTFIGRSKSRISPDTKLLITFCNPNPIPTLNAPARIVTFVKSIPECAQGDEEANEQDDIGAAVLCLPHLPGIYTEFCLHPLSAV